MAAVFFEPMIRFPSGAHHMCRNYRSPAAARPQPKHPFSLTLRNNQNKYIHLFLIFLRKYNIVSG